MSLTQQAFGTADGTPIELYTLQNENGMAADIMTFGATLVALRVPDRAGQAGDVVLGFEDFASYTGAHPYFGAVIGRYGNRIAQGRFSLNGQSYTLAQNNGTNNLHGGPLGFDRVVWRAEPGAEGAEPSLTLRYTSPDGDQGFPGTLEATITYTLGTDNTLRLDYSATTDQDTVVNLTNHSYFNLAGGGDILGHIVELPATRFVPVSADLIPTGELQPVAGTPMDFRIPTAVGAHIGDDDGQLHAAGGYDHTWVLDRGDETGLVLAARVSEPSSGRVMEVLTTEPGVQFYSGNFLDGTLAGKRGQRYERNTGLCLETQHFPDSPNQPQFPSTILRLGETYRSSTVFRFRAMS